jgi:hypothetical protein
MKKRALSVCSQMLGPMGIFTHATIGISTDCIVTPIALNTVMDILNQVYQALLQAISNRLFSAKGQNAKHISGMR